MKGVIHTCGYAVIQVKYRRDTNIKLSVNLFTAAFFLCIAIFGISLEALIRLRDA